MSGYTVPFIIGGKERRAEKTYDVVSPASGEVIHRGGIATEADAADAVPQAQEAADEAMNG